MTRQARFVKPSLGFRLRPRVERLEDRTLLSFSPPAFFNTGQDPWYVITEDVDGDKVLDLVSANLEGNSVSVLLGRGDGTFAAARNFTVGTRPYQVRAGHFNDDGFLDLISVNDGSSSLSLLLGNGDGTFRAAIHTPTDGTARGLAVGDFNQDGFFDAVVAAPFDRVAVHLSNGDGTFRPRVNYAAPSNPQAVVVGDFNQDGHLDFVVASLNSASVRRYLGNGDGSFQPGVNFAATTVSLYLHAADFNDDGFLDVATDARFNGVLSLQLNDGKGGLQIVRSVQTGGESYGIGSGDFDEDGRRDLVTSNVGRNTVSLMRGNGDGTFQPPITITVGSLDFTRPNAVAVGDFNGDGSVDFAVVNQRMHQVAVLLNRPNATRLAVTAPSNPVAGAAFTITVRALDEGGTVASNYRGTVRFTSSDPAAGLPSNYTFTAADRGVKTFTVTLRTAGERTITATDTKTGSITGEARVAVSPAAAVRLAVLGFPLQTTAGVAGGITVTARDEFGNVATGYRGVVRFTSTDPQAVLPGNYGFQFGDNGTRTFTATLRTAGTHAITVTDTATGSINGTQSGIVVNPAAASELRIESPTTIAPGQFLPLAVRARDPFGNTATGYRGTIHFTMTDPRATLPGDYTFTAGDAGFRRFTSLVPRTAGRQTITVRDTENPSLNRNFVIDVVIPAIFGNPVHLNVGPRPDAIATGDFNADGLLDIVTANTAGNNVSLLLGFGDGTFLNALNFPAGGNVTSLAVGDFNKDGALDLVMTASFPFLITMVRGNGDGTFGAPTTVLTGLRVVDLTVADFNFDGLLDLAAVDEERHVVSVQLGNGDGTFRTNVTYATDRQPQSVTTGDLNNDGILDLVTGNENQSVSVLLGNGDGTFRAALHHGVGGRGMRGVVVGDLNGDGNQDLVTANNGGPSVSVLLGRGNNTFFTSVEYPTNRSPESLQIGDVNGDGILDILTADRDTGVSVLVGFGDGGLQPALSYPAGQLPWAIALGDFNGDGAPDLAAANFFSHTVTVRLNLAPAVGLVLDAPASRIAGVPFPINVGAVNAWGWATGNYRGTVRFSSSDPQATLPGDYTFTQGDAGWHAFSVTLRTLGTQTITVRDTVTGTLVATATVNVGNPSLFYPAVNYGVGSGPYNIRNADLNGDGVLDLVTANNFSSVVSVLLGNGNGTFRPASSYEAGGGATYLVVADYNNDGRFDLATFNDFGNFGSVLLGNGDGTFGAPLRFTAGSRPIAAAVNDFNQDGWADLAVANTGSGNVSVLLGNGDGTFRSPIHYPTGTWARDVVAQDFDSDSVPDLAVANQGTNTVTILLNRGDGSFTVARQLPTGPDPSSLTFGDLNGDGIFDLISGNFTFGGGVATISVLIGNGDGTFRAAISYSVERNAHGATVADLNGDGLPDIAVANHGGETISVLLGNGDGTFQGAIHFRVGSGPLSVTPGDFNGDGTIDLAVSNVFSNNVSVLLNATTPTPGPDIGQPGLPPDGWALLPSPVPGERLVPQASAVEAFYLEEMARRERRPGLPALTSELLPTPLRLLERFRFSEISEAFAFVSILEQVAI